MFSLEAGKPVAVIKGEDGKKSDYAGKILGIVDEPSNNVGKEVILNKETFEPFLDLSERCIEYIAGPSGVGKSTMTASLVKKYKKINPNAAVIVFSRADISDDPSFKDLLPEISQARIDDEMLAEPMDVTKLPRGTLLVFDDIGTVYDSILKAHVQKLIMDCAEVGRKYGIYMIVTSHLIIPSERNFARVMMNEMQNLTVFPNSGTDHQIRTVLEKYLGLSKEQIKRIVKNKSRWVRIHTRHPRWVLTNKEAYML